MEKVNIRRVRVEDAQRISEIRKMPEVIDNIMASKLETTNTIKTRINSLTQNEIWFVAEIDNIVVGMIALNKYNYYKKYSGTITIMLDTKYHSKGIGSALMYEIINFADNILKLKRIELTVFETNINAIKLYEKFGFRIEGKKEASIYLNDRFENELLMARII